VRRSFLTDETFKDFPAIRGQMRVQWTWPSKSFNGFLRHGTLASKNSDILQNALEIAQPFSKTRETWWINSKPRSWYVAAVRLPAIPGLSGYAKVAALPSLATPVRK